MKNKEISFICDYVYTDDRHRYVSVSARNSLVAETWALASVRTNTGGPQTQGAGAAMAPPRPGPRSGEAATELAPCPLSL